MKAKYIIADDGVKLAYFESGHGSKTVIFISGYSAPAISWCKQAKALNRAGIRTISFDRRCHGASEVTDEGMTMLRHGQDVRNLIEALDLHDVILCGQSQGASTIWAYVSQYGSDRLSAIVSVDQTPKMINEGDWQCGMYGLTRDTRPTFFDAPIPAPNRKPIDKGILLHLLLHKKYAPDFDQKLTKALLLDHTDADWRSTIASTQIPALFIAGGDSPFWPCEHAKLMANLAPKGSCYIVESCGHAVNWECKNEFNNVLLDFVQKL